MGYGPLDSTYDLPLLVTEYRPGRGDGPADGWNPSNFDGRYLGSIPFSRALFESRNTVAVRLAQEITTTPIKYLARLAGINSPITTQLSMSLGSASISLLELSHAYTVFPNLGRLLPVRYITEICDKNNEIADISSPFPRDVVLPQYAYTMVRLLTGVADFGTGIRSRKADFEKAGKTGTSNDFRDNWFIGFTPDILVGVWIGKDNFESLGRNFTGGDTACPIFTDFLTSLDLKSNSFFSAPNGVYTCPLDLTGLSDCSPGEDTSYQVFPEPGLFIESIEMLDEGEDMISF
jgi:penicillin-binding protein 1A